VITFDGGTLDNSLGTGVTVANGKLQGEGTVIGNVLNQDTVAPGTSAGVLVVNGAYFQDVTGVLSVEVGGIGNTDLLNVAGAASLAGDLEIALISGVTPSSSDIFTILNAASLSGAFQNVANGGRLNIAGGGTGSFQVNYGAGSPFDLTTVVLSDFTGMGTSLPGDYNLNNVVDAADYVLWRKTPNNFGGDPDGYNTWRANFGQPSGSGSVAAANATVPEPTTLVMLIFAAVSCCLRRGRAA
jgi:hypothetical protein